MLLRSLRSNFDLAASCCFRQNEASAHDPALAQRPPFAISVRVNQLTAMRPLGRKTAGWPLHIAEKGVKGDPMVGLTPAGCTACVEQNSAVAFAAISIAI
jgi:hypothetical protein